MVIKSQFHSMKKKIIMLLQFYVILIIFQIIYFLTIFLKLILLINFKFSININLLSYYLNI